MNNVTGKSIFIWNVPDCFGGDPVKIALWLREHGFTSVMVKAADGAYVFYPSWLAFPNWLTSMFRLGRPNVDANFVDTLHAHGLKVYGWQFNYGRDPEGEGKVAAEQCNNLKLDGWVVDIEGEFESKATPVGNAGKWIGKWRQYIATPVPVILCTWAEFYSPGGSQWHNISLAKFWMSLPEVVAGMPMVYEDNYGIDGKPIPTTDAMMSSYFNYVLKQWAFWTKDLIPAGRAYIGDGGIPTHESVLTFGTIARERCVGATYWVMDRAIDMPIIADALRQTPSWDTPLPDPPAPVPNRYTGTVFSNVSLGLKVRTSPVTGSDVGKLAANTSFVGDDSFIDSKGGLWIHITNPATGWIASWYANYTDHLDPPPVEQVPAIPGPFYLLSPGDIGEPWSWPEGALDAYPAVVHTRGGVGQASFEGAWLAALRAIMTAVQWAKTWWPPDRGWNNDGEEGHVKEIEFAHNIKWVTRVNSDGWYEYDVYYLSDPPPNLNVPVDPYRRGIMTIDYKYDHEDTGGIVKDDYLRPYISIARDRTEKLRIDPKYLRSLASLPMKVTVKTGGGNLNVRDMPSTGAVITTLPNGSGATVFELRKVGNGVWGRVTSQGSVPGWIALWLTDWRPFP